MFTVCFYRGLDCIREVERPSKDAAILVAMEALRPGSACEVSIYTPAGRVLRGWERRQA